MSTRREFLKNTGMFTVGMLMGCRGMTTEAQDLAASGFMPDEGEHHVRTWMAFE